MVGLDSSRNVSELGVALALEEQPTKSEITPQSSKEATTKVETSRKLSGERT